MSFLTILLVLEVTVIFAAQGCHCTNGCQPVQGTPYIANSQGQACMDDCFGRYCQFQNIARNKTANQSSTWSGGDAEKAVDGNIDTTFNNGGCSHTNAPEGHNASWHVFLDPEQTFTIHRIKIYLRGDNSANNKNMTVFVNGQMFQKVPDDALKKSGNPVYNPVQLNHSTPVTGNNVTIVMAGRYLALCEVQVLVCGDGWFGNDCEHQCQCRNLSEVCDKQSGYCSSGCAVGRYGDRCLGSCHCSNGCDSFPGAACSTQAVPVCKPHWFGPYCQMENIAYGKTADQSSTYNEGLTQYNAALAVDGNSDTNFNAQSCSHTNGAATASWHVNLDAKFLFNISRIRIYLRNDSIDQWHDNDTDVMVSGQLCQHFERSSYVTDVTLKVNPLNVTCSPPIRGRNVSIEMNAPYLSLCEVQVFVCSDGWFGNDCEYQCQCNDSSEVCDKQSGYCSSGCAVGRYGGGCLECVRGFYGPSCTKCGRCKHSDACDIHDGRCVGGCESGYLKPTCLQVCHDSWFGTNCTKKCKCNNITEVCDKVNGNCRSGCLAGKRGSGCQDDCPSGQYGFNCSYTCGHCSDVASCRKDDGNCKSGCEVGYSPPLCKDCENGQFGRSCSEQCQCRNKSEICEKTTGSCRSGCIDGKQGEGCQEDCASGQYGFNCSFTCGHCSDVASCRKDDGNCTSGCEVGYSPPLCKVAQQSNAHRPQSMIGVIVGVVVAVFLVAALVVVLIYIRRRSSQNSHKEDETEEDITESSFSEVSSERTASTSMKSTKPVKPPKKPKPPADNVYENSDPYYNVLPAPVRLDRLMQYVRERVTGMGFEHEYKLLRHGLNGEHTEGRKPENKKRNRFLALFPYDASRVVLSPDGDATCDYIHASYVQGFHETSVFIAAQGPNNVTVDDFWRMIWQENVSQIVMLTRVMELNRKKCEQYWPDGMKEKTCGNILIKPLLATVRADFTIRKFLVQHSNKPSDKRTVTQLHFTSWPDHDVPSAPALVGFWKQYRSLVSSEEDITGPVVVHCSAGVGRTGTFIALDNLFDEAESLNKVNVFACVSKMREARMDMVQTVEQYRFVHESVMEAIASRGTFYTLSDFEKKFGTEVKYTRQQEMEMNKQFQSLESMKMEIPGKLASDAYLPDNISKNRNKDIVPANRVRPFLSTPVADHNDYINAVVLPSATQPLGLLATQTPLTQTVVDFWRLVYDHDCFTIVCLEDNQALYPRQNATLNIGPFRITTLQVDTSRDSFTEMQLNLALREQDNTHQQIRVFKLRSQIPGPPEPFLDFVSEVGTKGSSEEHRTLVHCPDGARLCGVFCSVLNIISRLRLDKEVDIYLTIRELQCFRPQFIQSYVQYKFCYDLVKEYLRDSSVYANL